MAKESLFEADVIVDPESLRKLQKTIPKALAIASINTIERLMDKVEEVSLIGKYTQTAKPRKPLGSTYIRTFALQRSSKKRIISNQPPSIEGKWEADIKYASRVIGSLAEQDMIHAGRWPPFETVMRSLKIWDQRFFDEEIARLK